MRKLFSPFLLSLILQAAPPAPPHAPVLGKPCLFTAYFPEWRCFPAILRDGVGNLRCGTNLLNNGGKTQAPPAAGNLDATPMAVLDGRQPRMYFTYRDPNGGVQALWFTRILEHDTWHHRQLSQGGATGAPPAAGEPSGLVVGGVFHATYRDLEGAIVDLARPEDWTFSRLKALGAGAMPPAGGDPVQALHQGIRHVVYRDLEGGLQALREVEGQRRAQRLNLGGALRAPAALGQPALLVDGESLHVIYRDDAGNVQDLAYDGTWRAQRVNRGGLTQAAGAAGDPAVASIGGVRHIVYRDLSGHLEHVWFDGTWKSQTLNLGAATEAPAAAGDPFVLAPPSRWLLVSYVDGQGHAQLVTLKPGSGWSAGPLAQTKDRPAQ
jgi:hypothetical protein